MKVEIRRVYEPPGQEEGYRVLVDRLWPRGIRKEDLEFDTWEKDLAPSTELRKWFNHEPTRWQEFHEKYRRELETAAMKKRLEQLVHAAGKRNITLLYSARDTEHNHAVILAAVIKGLY